MNRPAPESLRVSKTLSYWLRHAPEAARLHLDAEGWTEINAILAAFEADGIPVDLTILRNVVAESDKKRFEISDDGLRIRARQGHSVNVDAGWREASPPLFLYHGTVERVVETILREGLAPGSRHHVHLSPDIETARRVGMRRGAPIIFEIAAEKLAKSGEPFFLSTNSVWLVRHVPPTHLRILDIR